MPSNCGNFINILNTYQDMFEDTVRYQESQGISEMRGGVFAWLKAPTCVRATHLNSAVCIIVKKMNPFDDDVGPKLNECSRLKRE